MEDRMDEESNHHEPFVKGLGRGGNESWMKHSFLPMQICDPITQPEKAECPEILSWGCRVLPG